MKVQEKMFRLCRRSVKNGETAGRSCLYIQYAVTAFVVLAAGCESKKNKTSIAPETGNKERNIFVSYQLHEDEKPKTHILYFSAWQEIKTE